MQTGYKILSIAHRIHYITHCKQNTLYYGLHTEYIILGIAHRIHDIKANRMHYIKHCTQNTLY